MKIDAKLTGTTAKNMSRETGLFPSWAFRIAPVVCFLSGVVMGINTGDPEVFLHGSFQKWSSVVVAVVSMGLCNATIIDWLKKD